MPNTYSVFKKKCSFVVKPSAFISPDISGNALFRIVNRLVIAGTIPCPGPNLSGTRFRVTPSTSIGLEDPRSTANSPSTSLNETLTPSILTLMSCADVIAYDLRSSKIPTRSTPDCTRCKS